MQDPSGPGLHGALAFEVDSLAASGVRSFPATIDIWSQVPGQGRRDGGESASGASSVPPRALHFPVSLGEALKHSNRPLEGLSPGRAGREQSWNPGTSGGAAAVVGPDPHTWLDSMTTRAGAVAGE